MLVENVREYTLLRTSECHKISVTCFIRHSDKKKIKKITKPGSAIATSVKIRKANKNEWLVNVAALEGIIGMSDALFRWCFCNFALPHSFYFIIHCSLSVRSNFTRCLQCDMFYGFTNVYMILSYIEILKFQLVINSNASFISSTGIDDKRRRLRGFLTCMRSDTPLMLNISYVPQHLLVMACVLRYDSEYIHRKSFYNRVYIQQLECFLSQWLRYIMTFSDKIKILRRQELDAFIAQAFSADLMNTQYLQDLQVIAHKSIFGVENSRVSTGLGNREKTREFYSPSWKWNIYATYTTFWHENIFRGPWNNICQI